MPEGLLGALLGGDPDDLAIELFNALEPAALAQRPRLDRTRTLIRQANAHEALVSGSGPTLLGLAGNADHAREIAEVLLPDLPRVLLAPGPVAGAHVVEY